MKTLLCFSLITLLATAVLPAAGAGGDFHCQDPELTLYGISSGFDAEFADDIPNEFVGRVIGKVTLWAGEWYSVGGPGWTEPTGVSIAFYNGTCPPDLDSFVSFSIPWQELEKELVLDGTVTIYKVVATLPEEVTIVEEMSIGATMDISWGTSEPMSGLSPTPVGSTYGACEAWLDAPNWGYTRWTVISWPSGQLRDLAYCLAEGDPYQPVPMVITGPGPAPANPPLVRTWDPHDTGAPTAQWTAYGVDQFGVNVAAGDLDGDGSDEILTGAGPGAVFGPHVRGWEVDGSPLAGASFMAYGTPRWGVNVTAGDLDGDGYDEIITGAGPGAVFGPHVRAFDYDGGPSAIPDPGVSYFAYGTLKWGVNVAAGDIDGDGFDEIITGAGPGAVFGAHVRGWDHDGTGGVTPAPGVSYFAYGTPRFGVNVGSGDLDGDGIDEIITGPGPGEIFGAHVRAWDTDSGGVVQMPGVSYFAYIGTTHGVRVAAADVDGDGIEEILTVPGPDPAAAVQVLAWNVDQGSVVQVPGLDFFAYDQTMTHGGCIAGGTLTIPDQNP
jgi:hypothetical protein